MARIKSIIGIENKGTYAIVHVLTDDGDEAKVYVGGSVELFFDKGQIKAFVKKNKD